MNIKEYLRQNSKVVNPYCDGRVAFNEASGIPKGAKSVKDPSQVPKGWSTVKGPRGGTYAVPPSGGKEPNGKQTQTQPVHKQIGSAIKQAKLPKDIAQASALLTDAYEKGELDRKQYAQLNDELLKKQDEVNKWMQEHPFQGMELEPPEKPEYDPSDPKQWALRGGKPGQEEPEKPKYDDSDPKFRALRDVGKKPDDSFWRKWTKKLIGGK